MTCVDFQEALKNAEAISQNRPTLLLGNGFGIAYDARIFSYKALFKSVDWSKAERVRRVFEALGTWDFELAIRDIEVASKIIEIYKLNGDASGLLREDAAFLKQALISAIQETHPAHIFEVNATRIGTTANFLRNFGQIFTVNYDLLLYWTLVQPNSGLSEQFRDGFKLVDKILEWRDFPDQRVLYLHGALHLFQQDGRLEKIKYQGNTPRGTLIQQIAERINRGYAPLVVCEGTNEQKLIHIRSSRYLRFCFDKLQTASGALLIYGHSLADADQHILQAIASSRVSHLFVSLYGNPESDHNQYIQRKAESIKARQGGNVKVIFYKAESANIW